MPTNDSASAPPALPPRPTPGRRPAAQLAAWSTWFGPARLIGAAVSVAVVVAGALWLVRTPVPPTEAGLPRATVAVDTTAATRSIVSTVPASTGPAVVHVAGAVRAPGVYTIGGDARVHTAIELAGGLAADADPDGLNLAAPVADGQRIYVPVAGEVDPAAVPTDTTATSGPPGPVDLNRATAAELEALPGIGPATATAIVDDRERSGPFASVDELERVPGIGPAKRAALAGLVTV